MATTFDDLKRFLDEAGLNYDAHDEHDVVAISFESEPTDTSYRNHRDESQVLIIVRLAEQGEFLAAFAPRAWSLAGCPHRAAVCEAATRVQAQMKLIRFDFDEAQYLQPNVEIPLEEAPLCAAQLHRAITAILVVIRRFDPVFRQAMETGEVDMALVQDDPPEPPAEVTEILDIATAAGGLDAVEKLLGGDDAPAVEP
jgi:hypothetical protein